MQDESIRLDKPLLSRPRNSLDRFEILNAAGFVVCLLDDPPRRNEGGKKRDGVGGEIERDVSRHGRSCL